MNALSRIAERCTSAAVAASDRPRRIYSYWVTGKGYFPFDMLRYDAAWPANTEAALQIEPVRSGDPIDHRNRYHKENRSIHLYSYREPTPDRWWSFGWSVSAEKF